MVRFRSLVPAIVASFALAAPAQAVVVVGTFSGVITGGTDSAGSFTGVANSPLDVAGPGGGPFGISGSFSYDTDAFAPDGSGLYGGDGVTEWITFEILIAGTSYQFGTFAPTGGQFQFASVVNDDPFLIDALNLQYQRGGDSGTETIGIDLSGEQFLGGTGLPLSFSYTGLGGGAGSLLIQTGAGTASEVDAVADFAITSASAAPVPEPLVWLNLIVGFGAMGGLLRRRFRLRTVAS